jgi:hypothetical protein
MSVMGIYRQFLGSAWEWRGLDIEPQEECNHDYPYGNCGSAKSSRFHCSQNSHSHELTLSSVAFLRLMSVMAIFRQSTQMRSQQVQRLEYDQAHNESGDT